ncbi:uncharacterized protein KY384_000050 [Bacidia gigantensis]|uniref:uncharacterized protein n=1 Tax=Bacidia gigantensis TaxID=2732470 RepID=UPI001D057FF2|nr:uncharacterized protein KY384_000050 [Bacidia gigantensis]KAG8526457.1 hypothetical protein KY384_000050 [Bacidia gigantensis]
MFSYHLFKQCLVLWLFIIIDLVAVSLTPDPLTLNFGSFSNRTTYVIAAELGYFENVDLVVKQTDVASSTSAYNSVVNGTLDLLDGTFDNIIDKRINQGQQLSAIAQLDQGDGLVLVGSQDIKSVEQLRGKSLLVDSPTSGFVFLARRILGLYGLQYPKDYKIEVLGAQRTTRLLAGGAATINSYAVFANLLTTLNTTNATTQPRLNTLARAQDFVDPFSNRVLTVASATLSHPTSEKYQAIQRFVTALLRANAYLNDPENRESVVRLLQRSGGLGRKAAEGVYDYSTSREVGEVTKDQEAIFQVSRLGLLNVIDIRRQFEGFMGLEAGFNFVEAIMPGEGKLINYRVRDAAVQNV